MRVLIGIPSPRDIPEFIEATVKIDDDKLWVKYYDEYTAYKYIRQFFLKHKEYTHLCLLPDDLIVRVEQYEKLKEQVHLCSYPVFSGVFNSDYLNQDFLTHYPVDGNNIKQVEAEGFGCCFICREVVENIPFDARASFDIYFSKECKRLNIPLYVDTSVVLLHLARRNESPLSRLENMGIGFFIPDILYQVCLKNLQ